MSIINYELCDDELIDHTLNDCGKELLAGISGAVVLFRNHQLTDPSSAAQINTEIAAGRAKLLDNVKIGLNEPEAVEIDSNTVGATQDLATYNRSGTGIDGNVSATNNTFYDGLLGGRTFGGAILYLKGTEESDGGAKVAFIDAKIKFKGGLPIQNNNDQNMTYTWTFAWRKLTMPSFHTAPTGIFIEG